MKRFLAILMLLAVLGCGEPTPLTSEEYLEFWEDTFVQAAEDVGTARTSEEYTDACNRMLNAGNQVIEAQRCYDNR